MTRPLAPDPNQDPHAEFRTVPDADQSHRRRPHLRGIARLDRRGAARRVHVALADRKSATSIVWSHPAVPRGARHGSGGLDPGRPADRGPRGADHLGLPPPAPPQQPQEPPPPVELSPGTETARNPAAYPPRNGGAPTLADIRARHAAYYRRGGFAVDRDPADF